MSSRHPELDSGSSHRGKEGSPLTPTLSRRAREKRAAFTLAEVLITLAIIGVVAAMTIPTLVVDYQKKVVETKLLKVYSVMNNAIKLSSIDNGPIQTWPTLGHSQDTTATYDDVLEWCNKYLFPYMSVQKVEKLPTSEDVLAYLPDGSMLHISNYLYDVNYFINGNNTSNAQTGKDSFMFRLGIPIDYSRYTNQEAVKYVKAIKGFEPYVFDWNGTLDNAKNHSSYGCYSSNWPVYCTKVIQLNNWKIPKDYPYFK